MTAASRLASGPARSLPATLLDDRSRRPSVRTMACWPFRSSTVRPCGRYSLSPVCARLRRMVRHGNPPTPLGGSCTDVLPSREPQVSQSTCTYKRGPSPQHRAIGISATVDDLLGARCSDKLPIRTVSRLAQLDQAWSWREHAQLGGARRGLHRPRAVHPLTCAATVFVPTLVDIERSLQPDRSLTRRVGCCARLSDKSPRSSGLARSPPACLGEVAIPDHIAGTDVSDVAALFGFRRASCRKGWNATWQSCLRRKLMNRLYSTASRLNRSATIL